MRSRAKGWIIVLALVVISAVVIGLAVHFSTPISAAMALHANSVYSEGPFGAGWSSEGVHIYMIASWLTVIAAVLLMILIVLLVLLAVVIFRKKEK